MEEVEQGRAELAMIPLENSTAGRVEEIYRLIPQMSLHIADEHFEAVNHCLMVPPGATLAGLKTVYSHPQALAQCAEKIRILGVRAIATLDTAGAAMQVSRKNDPSEAAIASSLAAELYGLTTLEESFQDMTGNTTRFIILTHEQRLPPLEQGVNYITSLLFKVRNIPAALYKALGGFATNQINLVKLESYMPAGTLNATQFYVDIEGHVNARNMQNALEELSFFAEEVRLLGTYAGHSVRASKIFQD
jgi:prephenate dehydratase